MINRICLIIDDDLSRINSTIDNVKAFGSDNNMDISFIPFNPTDREFSSPLDGSIDKDKIKIFLHEKLLKQKIDLIACDYQLEKSFTGLDIVNIIREKRKTKLIIYSGKIDKIVADLLEANKEDNDNKTILKSIRILITKGISDFIENDINKLEQALIKYIQIEPNLEEIFENTLSNTHQELIFKSTYPNFKNKTVSEIIKIISNDSLQSEEFKSELVEQLIDFMVELNK